MLEELIQRVEAVVVTPDGAGEQAKREALAPIWRELQHGHQASNQVMRLQSEIETIRRLSGNFAAVASLIIAADSVITAFERRESENLQLAIEELRSALRYKGDVREE